PSFIPTRGPPGRDRSAVEEGIRDPAVLRADRLHDVPPMKSAIEKTPSSERLDLAAARSRLGELSGREYWRSIEELLETEDFREHLAREFRTPVEAEKGFDRRELLTLMGASIALAGLTGCVKQPTEKIYPYVKPPEELVPGVPLFYATAQ